MSVLIKTKLKYRQWYVKAMPYKPRTGVRKGYRGPINWTKETWGFK